MATADRAEAYSIETLVTPGCHERISSEALAAARARGAELPGLLAATTDDRALVEDLPFAFPDTVDPRRDLGAVALLVGVREPDLRGNEPTDFHDLSPVHAAEETQAEHCLRRAADDEPAGARVALAACRAFVERELAAAAEAAPGGRRTRLPVFLAVQGRPRWSSPRRTCTRASRSTRSRTPSPTRTGRTARARW